jgi:hypothetical protein
MLGHCFCSLYWTQTQCYRPAVNAAVTDITEFAVSAGGYRRAIVGIDDAGPEQIGQMLTSAFANRLLAAAEEPPTAQ